MNIAEALEVATLPLYLVEVAGRLGLERERYLPGTFCAGDDCRGAGGGCAGVGTGKAAPRGGPVTWWAVFGVGTAAVNVGLTVYHWRLVGRAQERLRRLDQLHAEAVEAGTALEAFGSNGHRGALEVRE